jgi:hypothetical protein
MTVVTVDEPAKAIIEWRIRSLFHRSDRPELTEAALRVASMMPQTIPLL